MKSTCVVPSLFGWALLMASCVSLMACRPGMAPDESPQQSPRPVQVQPAATAPSL